jgi:hypothetical protein
VLGRPNTRLADEISEEFIRYGRFRPGPPRNTKTTFGWFFHLRLYVLDAPSYNEFLINI